MVQNIRQVTVDTVDHLIEMPYGARARPGLPDVGGNGQPEFLGSASDCFVGNIDAARGQQFFHIPKTEGEAVVQPHRLADHLWREAVSLVGYLSHLASFIGDKLPLY
jgi:hypothetical protein